MVLATPALAAAPSDTESRIYSEQVAMLYAFLPFALLWTLVVSTLTWYFLRPFAPAFSLGLWLAAVLLLTALRLVLWLVYRRQTPDSLEARRWGRYYVVAIFLSGVLWGALGAEWMSYSTETVLLPITALISGILGLGAVSLFPYYPALVVLAVPQCLPLIWRLLSLPDPERLTALVLVVNCLVAIAGCRRISLRNAASLRLRFEAAELAERHARAERTALAASRDLEASNRELTAFSYSVSHDLRAPLRGIDGWSLALLEDCGPALDDRGREYLGRVRSEALKMGQLIDGLLELSKVIQVELRPRAVDFSELCHGFVSQLRDRQPERRVEVVIAPELRAWGDPALLRSVVVNLLENAWLYTRRSNAAKIEVGEREVDGVRAFFVRDNGVGFDMAFAGKLFLPFQRLHRQSDFAGTGVGLANVRRVVERHGGRIWAEAAVDQGATFYFTLPLAASPSEVVTS